MNIVIVQTADAYEVRVIDDDGLITRKVTYRDLRAARRAAVALQGSGSTVRDPKAALPEIRPLRCSNAML
jgi:hypothetical protein